MRYTVIIEPGNNSYGAYVPDLPGCVAVGETLEEVRTLIAEAIAFHLEALQEQGEAIAPPRTLCDYVEVGEFVER